MHDDADPIERRRAKRRAAEARRLYLVLGGLALAVLVAGVGVVAWKRGRGPDGNGAGAGAGGGTGGSGGAASGGPADGGRVEPAAGSQTWTYREMADRLAARGCNWTFIPVTRRRPFGDPRPDHEFAALHAPGRESVLSDLNIALDRPTTPVWPTGVVAYERFPTAEDARQAAGRSAKRTWVYGNWVFTGDPAMLEQAQAALR